MKIKIDKKLETQKLSTHLDINKSFPEKEPKQERLLYRLLSR